MLYEKLKEYGESDAYPFHMPGHKRQLNGFENPYAMDITEIDGFDNLHGSEGILKAAQDRAARLFGAKKAWYLVNGSTCGLLAAVSAALPKGAKVLAARNCHKAVYHAMTLRNLRPVYLYPELTSRGLQGQISAETICKAIAENPDAKAVILTSPTYDGILSDIKTIASLVHEAGMVLIVDQAHGAHFDLPGSPFRGAGSQGADLVIVSTHKTLPAFTQTALLFRYTDRVRDEKIEYYLDVFETSSPSYLLMAGIERAVDIMEREGGRLFSDMSQRMAGFYWSVSGLRKLKVLTPEDFSAGEAWQFDAGKVLIMTGDSGLTGPQLADRLRKDFHLEPEMVQPGYVLALCSVMDTDQGMKKLSDALCAIDTSLAGEDKTMNISASAYRTEASGNPASQEPAEKPAGDVTSHRPVENPAGDVTSHRPVEKPAGDVTSHGPVEKPAGDMVFYVPQEKVMEIQETEDLETENLSYEDAAGRISAAYIYLYPPGIPLIVPGERITEGLFCRIRAAQAAGLEVCGLPEKGRICTVRKQKI